jgi:arginase
MSLRSITILGVPLYTLAKYRGMGAAVKELRKLGIAEPLKRSADSFTDLGDAHVTPIITDSGPSNMRNFSTFVDNSAAITDRASMVPGESFMFCLGGECGLAVGVLAGLRSKLKGTPGLVWLDAHGDFNTPETTQSGFVGGMPLAFVCGRGPNFPASIERYRPLVKEENVIHLGSRDLDPLEARAFDSSPIRVHSTASLRKEGIERTVEQEVAYLADNADWIVCHLDVDVLDPTVIPAVSFPTKDGLNVQDVRTVIKRLVKTDKLRAFNLAAYEPTQDPDLAAGRAIVSLVSEIFATK